MKICKGIYFRVTFDSFVINQLYISNYFYQQIKVTATGAVFVAVGSNLTVSYFKETMFAILPQNYPKDFVEFFIQIFYS